MYTEEQTELAIKLYLEAGKDNSIIPEIAEKLGKNTRSVIGKLSREGIYEKQVYTTKQGGAPITKKELVHKIAIALDMDLKAVAGLEKAPKSDLQNLSNRLEDDE